MFGTASYVRLSKKALAQALPLATAFFGFLTPLSGGLAAQVQPQAQPRRTIVVDSIRVEGWQRIQPQSIVGLFGVQPGDEVGYRDIQRGLKELLASGQFRDVQVLALDNPEGVIVLRVEEQARVRRIVFDGLENVSTTLVRDTVGLSPGLPLNQQAIFEARDFIRAELVDEGIPFARIEERIVPVDGANNEVDLFIDVDEGQRVTVASVEFFGNELLNEPELRSAMSVKGEGFWWFQSGQFNEIDYQNDLSSGVPSFYRSLGYLDARVVSDTIIVDPETGKARLEVTVEEGEQYALNSFTVTGNTQFPTASFENLFLTPTGGILRTLGLGGTARTNAQGQVFDAEAFELARQRALERYHNNGYLYAQVNPIVTRIETENGPMVDASWEVIEGTPALVNRVNIVGNDYTHEWVIRQQLTVLPGDVYSQERVIRSYQNISGLGFFETPLPPPDIEPNPETGDVDITFQVSERQTGSINFGTSVGGGVGLSGFIGYEQPNLFGQAKSGSLRWDFGRYINSVEVAYTDPALFQSTTSGTIQLFNSRDRYYQFASGRRQRLGANVRFGFPWRGSLFTRLFVGYGISRTRYEQFSSTDDTSLFGRPPGVQSQLSLGVTRQTLDHPIFPSVGSRQNLTVELNGGWLGGDGDFTRVLADGSYWVPVGQIGGDGIQGGIRMSIGLTLRTGMVFGDVDAFPFDRFWMGGVQFGQNLRGYDETSITPIGYYPERSPVITDIQRLANAHLGMSAVYAIRPSDQISLNLFYDAGNVWTNPGDINPTRLYRGAGFGVQLVTPFGPIGLDYAYGFDKPQPGWQLHFRMGPGF